MSALNKGSIQNALDPLLGQYLQQIKGGNKQRMAAQYADLGLDTSNEAMGMSPQESTDLRWLGQQANQTGTLLAQQSAPTLQAANNLSLSQLQQSANQANQTAVNSAMVAGLS